MPEPAPVMIAAPCRMLCKVYRTADPRARRYTLPVNLGKIAIFVALAVILGLPFALRPRDSGGAVTGPSLVIITPHVPQIRYEFGRAFSEWHRRHHGTGVRIDWRVPGGTSEIIKQLEAQYAAAARAGRVDFSDPKNPVMQPGVVPADLVMGGGSFDHGRLKTGVVVKVPGPDGQPADIRLPMSAPLGFPQEALDAWFGENAVGAAELYDPQQFWVGTALSGFGIVYNLDMLQVLGVYPPTEFSHLANPRLQGWVILADPRQSGSVTTTLDSILSTYGWENGWRLLREISANSRAFVNSSPKPPIEVSQGEAAAALAIDFYGRGQAQATLMPGQDPATSRVGYVDARLGLHRRRPHQSAARRTQPRSREAFRRILPDRRGPVSLAVACHQRAARLRQPHDFRRRTSRARALRAPPHAREAFDVRPSRPLLPALLRQGRPLRDRLADPARGLRSAIGVMMGAFAIDVAHDQRAAWAALNAARADASFPPDALKEMERLFYAWPTTLVGDKELEFTPENFRAIRDSWRGPGAQTRAEVRYAAFFRASYRRVVEISRSPNAAGL